MSKAANDLEALQKENAELKRDYNELIMAVERKFMGETRHETALRYIREVESRKVDGNDAAMQEKP